MKAWLVVPVVLLLAAGASSADAVLDRAHEREKAGDVQAAASLLASWLSANPGAAGSPAVFGDYLRVEQDFPVLLDRAAVFLNTARGVAGAAQQFQSIARLFDLAGRVEQARDAYLAAYAEGAPDSALVSAFLLSVRMNDTDSMAGVLKKLAGSSASAGILLQAIWDLRAGNLTSARTALVGLSEQTGDPELALRALWILYESAAEAGDAAGQSSARSGLAARFGASPESALAGAASPSASTAGRTIVVEAPAPGSLEPVPTPDAASAPAVPTAPAAPTAPATVGPPDVPASAAGQTSSTAADAAVISSPAIPSAPQDAAPPAPSAPKYSVQTGSFGMKENADDLCLELGKQGFTPAQVHDVAQGKGRYRVFAASGIDAEAARQVVARLAAAGFYGFVVRDR